MDTENLPLLTRILLVDDDYYLRSVLSSQLRKKGVMAFAEASRASEAFDQIDTFKPDLILLDMELPDGNGLDICQRLRAHGFQKPIIMLTGQMDEEDIAKGLYKGASDYIAKPMRFSELFSLVCAQLRQYKASDEERFVTQKFEFQPNKKTLTCLDTHRVIFLTEKETMMLKKLFQIWPETISKEGLLSEVWGYQNMLATHTLETHIYRLRKKIARFTKAPLVETTQGGYRLVKGKDSLDPVS
ncbi:MAG: response regulator transcription factor [Candidatus Puniceispirillaceae bacterium]